MPRDTPHAQNTWTRRAQGEEEEEEEESEEGEENKSRRPFVLFFVFAV